LIEKLKDPAERLWPAAVRQRLAEQQVPLADLRAGLHEPAEQHPTEPKR
jgi:hypothetical protein